MAAGLLGALILAPPLHAFAGAPAGIGTPAEQGFLASNAKSPGVVSLPGVQYKIIKSGPPNGPHPLRSDDITVRYVGQFIDGKVFGASSENGAGTEVFLLQKLIPGWIAALQRMRPGDVWMLYVPAYLAYGAVGKSYIPPNNTLIFRVELIGVGPHADSVAAQ